MPVVREEGGGQNLPPLFGIELIDLKKNTEYNLNSMVTLKLKLNSINGQIIATFLLYSSFFISLSLSRHETASVFIVVDV